MICRAGRQGPGRLPTTQVPGIVLALALKKKTPALVVQGAAVNKHLSFSINSFYFKSFYYEAAKSGNVGFLSVVTEQLKAIVRQ